MITIQAINPGVQIEYLLESFIVIIVLFVVGINVGENVGGCIICKSDVVELVTVADETAFTTPKLLQALCKFAVNNPDDAADDRLEEAALKNAVGLAVCTWIDNELVAENITANCFFFTKFCWKLVLK